MISSSKNPACKFPRTGLTPQEPVSRRRVPLVRGYRTPPETIQVASDVPIGNDHIGVVLRQTLPYRSRQYLCKLAS